MEKAMKLKKKKEILEFPPKCSIQLDYNKRL